MNFLILGSPNVGKTSLFNIISNNKNNIIHDTKGTTRDWHVSTLINNNKINIYDSPGIIENDLEFLNKIIKKLINKINIILYVVDYKNKNYFNDKEFINSLRKLNKEIILIINKDDNLQQDTNLDLLGLKKYFYISCAHKKGIDQLVSFINTFQILEYNQNDHNFTIGLFGKTNVGKSTLLNKLVGYDRSLVSEKPKTTTDIVNATFNIKEHKYLIKDTAGLIKKNKIDKNSLDYYVTKKTLSIINEIDVNLFLIDINQGFDNQSKKIFNIIYNNSNIVLFIINKIDLLKKNKKIILSKIIDQIKIEFSQSKNILIIPISAQNNKDIKKLKKFLYKSSLDIMKTISTSQINQWLFKAVEKNPHSRINGKEVKFKYATQVTQNPLTIKIFSNFTKEIKKHYRTYLLSNFYHYFKIKSKNIKIIISKSNNPYN